MKKIIIAGAGAAIVVLATGCSGSGSNSDQAPSHQSKITSMQSKLASDQREISHLKHDLTVARVILLTTKQRTEQEYDRTLAAVKKLQGRLKREQSMVSKSMLSGAQP